MVLKEKWSARTFILLGGSVDNISVRPYFIVARSSFLARPATRARKSFVHKLAKSRREKENDLIALYRRKSSAHLAYKLIARLYAMYFCEQY